jgi:hypothetical protein
MLTNRSMLVGISMLAIIGGGLYFGLSPGGIGEGTAPAGDAGNTPATSTKSCSFETSDSPVRSPVVINEIAWMGTKNSPNDEWIELKNISGSTTNMGGWELVNQNGKIKVAFKSGAKILAGDFYLLERGSTDFLPGIKADTFFIGSLKNSGDSFRLFDKDCALIDESLSSSSWPAGDNTSKKTMERGSETFKWYTSKIEGGTPKAENDGQNNQGPTVNGQVNTASKDTTSATAIDNVRTNATRTLSTSTQPTPSTASISPVSNIQPLIPSLLSKSNVNHILISQIQITGGTGKTSNDFIEIYNPTSQQFNLKGYRLVKRTQTNTSDTLIKSWTVDTFIPALGFYLWANSNFADISALPDSTTSETLSNDNGIAIRYGSNDTGAVIDSVAWGKAQNTFATSSVAFTSNPFPLNPSAGQSLLRKSWQNGACFSASLDSAIGNGCDTGNNVADFEWMQVSEPRNSSVKTK